MPPVGAPLPATGGGPTAPTFDPSGKPIAPGDLKAATLAPPGAIGLGTLAGGPPGSLQAVLQNLVLTIQSLVAAIGGGPAISATPPTSSVVSTPASGSARQLVNAPTARGYLVTVSKDPNVADSYRLEKPTGFDELVEIDGTRLAFNAQGQFQGLR
jgi:hypothetical protein